MSLFHQPAHGRSSWRYLLHLNHSPSPALPATFSQINAGSPSPPTPHSFFCSKPSHLGIRLLHNHCLSLPREPSVVPSLDANHPTAPFGIACRLAPLYIRLTNACAHPRLISYEFVATRSFSSSEAANLVIVSTEECTQELVEAAPIEASSVPATSDGSSTLGATSDGFTTLGAVDGVADGTQILSSIDESLQDGSIVAKLQKLEEIAQTSVELLNEGPAEKDGSSGSSISRTKDSEEFGSSVNRLEKMVEVQRLSLDEVRAQLENQKEIITSILKDVSFLKSQSRKLKSSTTDEERLEKTEMEENGSSVITSVERVSRRVDVSVKFQPPFWPEWTSFLEHLKSLNLFQADLQRLPEGCDIFEDPTQIKRAFYMFSRSYGPVFELLSRKDLQVLAEYGCQSVDQKTIASEQKLRNYFQIEGTSTSSESSEKSTIIPPSLSDVMRLIYSTAESAFSQKAALPVDVKSSVIHLLQEISRLSVENADSNPSSETAFSSSTQVKRKAPNSGRVGDSKEDQQKQPRRTKLGKDKKEEDAKATGKIETEARAEAGVAMAVSKEWKCPRCSFMNLQHKNRCVECSLKQPQKADSKSNVDQVMNEKGSAVSSLDEDMKHTKMSMTPGSKFQSEEKRLPKKKESMKQVTDSLGQSTEDEDTSDDHLSRSVIKDETSLDSDETSESSDADEHFDILDDIVEAEDSDGASDNKKGAGRKSSLSDLVDGDMDDFPRRKRRDQGGTARREDFGRNDGRRERGKRYGDEDALKSKRAPKNEDEDEDVSDEEESPRRSSRGGRNDFRGRGGQRYGGRGGRGYRGDSYDEHSSRRNDRGSGGSSSYDRGYSGDGDREYRSSSSGGGRFGRGRGRGRGSERGRGRSRY